MVHRLGDWTIWTTKDIMSQLMSRVERQARLEVYSKNGHWTIDIGVIKNVVVYIVKVAIYF